MRSINAPGGVCRGLLRVSRTCLPLSDLSFRIRRFVKVNFANTTTAIRVSLVTGSNLGSDFVVVRIICNRMLRRYRTYRAVSHFTFIFGKHGSRSEKTLISRQLVARSFDVSFLLRICAMS